MINKLDFDETIKIRELAEILGISERQIQRLTKDDVIKKTTKGNIYFINQSEAILIICVNLKALLNNFRKRN